MLPHADDAASGAAKRNPVTPSLPADASDPVLSLGSEALLSTVARRPSTGAERDILQLSVSK